MRALRFMLNYSKFNVFIIVLIFVLAGLLGFATSHKIKRDKLNAIHGYVELTKEKLNMSDFEKIRNHQSAQVMEKLSGGKFYKNRDIVLSRHYYDGTNFAVLTDTVFYRRHVYKSLGLKANLIHPKYEFQIFDIFTDDGYNVRIKSKDCGFKPFELGSMCFDETFKIY